MEMVKEKIERWKLLADTFEKQNISAFIKEINGDLHFCKILINGEDSVEVLNFAPEQRAGTKERIFWYLIQEFDECKNIGEEECEKEKRNTL